MRADPPALAGVREQVSRTPLALFLSGNLGLTFANGIQQVLFAWLVAVVLVETPERVGLAQAMLMLPALALLLFGGLIADRVDARRLLPPLHVLGALPPLGIAYALETGTLSYSLMLAYALVMGALGAFIGPARDALLSRVADGAIQRTVTLQLSATYLGQLGGFFLTAIDAIPTALALVIQAVALCFAAAAYAALRPSVPHPGRLGDRSGLHDILDALRESLASPRLRSALAIMLSIGVLLAGTWVVLLQLLVRDVYGGGRDQTSLFFACMMVGTLIGTGGCALRGGVRRMGRALLGGLGVAAVGAAGICFAPPLPLALASIVVWGVGGAVAMVMTRTISQESAPPTHRARVLSVFQLAVMGGAPLGAYVAGQVVAALGPAAASAFPAIGLVAVLLLALLTSDLLRVETEHASPEGVRT